MVKTSRLSDELATDTSVNGEPGFLLNGEPLRILFLGNMDNVNLRLCRWARRLGAHAEIYLLDSLPQRGAVHLIDPSYEERRPEWMHDNLPLNIWDPHQWLDLLSFAVDAGEQGTRWQQAFDCMVVSGPSGLLASRAVELPKVFMPVGSDLTDFPFLMNNFGRCGRNAFRLTRLVKTALRRIDVIFDSSQMGVQAAKRLGVSEKMLLTGFPEDVLENRRQVDEIKLEELQHRYQDARYVFLWLSRLNFTKLTDTNYKGVERYLRAMERHAEEVKRGEIRLVFTRHGEEYTQFADLIAATPLAQYVDWVDHLNYPDLLTYLSLSNAVLFSEFGDRELVISGITRDAMSVGTVTVSSADAEYNQKLYGDAPPILYARTTEDIGHRIQQLLGLTSGQFEALRQRGLGFGESCMDYRRYMRTLRNAIVSLVDTVRA